MILEQLRAKAIELDSADNLSDCKEWYVFPKDDKGNNNTLYFTGNSLGLLPKSSRVMVEEELDAWARLAVDGHFHKERPWVTYHQNIAADLAEIIGAKETEVCAMNTLTVNLHFLMVSFYKPTKERFKILLDEHAFPSDIYAAQSQAAFHGFDPDEAVVFLKAKEGNWCIDDEDIERCFVEHGSQLSTVMMSAVNFKTGQFFPVEKITALAKKYGGAQQEIKVGIDLAHAAGNVPLRLHDWGVDYAAGCTYKYLNGGPGSIAFAYVHDDLAKDTSIHRFAGWWGNDPKARFAMTDTFVPLPTAEGWQVSNAPILSMAPLVGSLKHFTDVGMDTLRAKSESLSSFLIECIDTVEAATPIQLFEIVTPRNVDERGCQVTLNIFEKPEAVRKALQDAGAVTDFRPPGLIRVAPTPMYNSHMDCFRFAEILASVLI